MHLSCLIVAALLWASLEASEVRPLTTGVLPPVEVNVAGGCFEAPFALRLSSPEIGTELRYTEDGSEPTPANGKRYLQPLSVTNTTVLRAAAFHGATRVTAISTHTYLFLEQVLRQPNNPPGYPTGPAAWKGQPSFYGMDARVVDSPLYRERIKAAMHSLPIVSIVCAREDMFSPRKGLYLNSLQRGEAWEKPCSVEWLETDGRRGFQIDCGIRIQGNYNRIPVKSPKHSFRLLFKEKYGPSKLHYPVFPDSTVGKFDTLVLRADYNNSWIHWDPAGRLRAQRTRDAWMKDSQRAMGWTSSHNRYLHLFLNGLYWGVYDAAERPDASFAAAYWGGHRQEYDVVNEFQVKDGSRTGFDLLYSMRGLGRSATYQKLQQQLNLPQFIDYLLLNYYAGNQDWGENKNWYAVRRHTPPGPFAFFVWDGEQVLQRLADNTVTAPFEVPMHLAEDLRENPEFCLAFADRVQKHCFNGGALTPAAVAARWMQRAREVDEAIIAESARWGASRRDLPYTRDQEWLTEQQRLLKTYFPRRTGIVLEQLRVAGLFPEVPAPVFHPSASPTNNPVELSISSMAGGVIYYTTNGTDPRVVGSGSPAVEALLYSKPWPLHLPCQVKARVRKGALWSALMEARWTNSPSGPG